MWIGKKLRITLFFFFYFNCAESWNYKTDVELQKADYERYKYTDVLGMVTDY